MSKLRILFVFLVLVAAFSLERSSTAPRSDFDRSRLEQVEDLSEALANDLLDFSVAARRKDLGAMRSYLAASLKATPTPSQPGENKPASRWTEEHAWQQSPTPMTIAREAYLQQWAEFLNHFSELEDVRFKVKFATFPSPGTGKADLKFFLIGRGCQGRREWVSGTARVTAEKAAAEKSRWRISEMILSPLQSQVATADLFHEVSFPAGVSMPLPSYGSPGNEGFVWNGAAAADVDRDGLIDVFVTGHPRNHLYRNLGNGRFQDLAEEAGVAWFYNRATTALFVDYDNDGDSDLFLSAAGTQMLFENRLRPSGKLSFEDVSVPAGVDRQAVGFSAAAADVNRDGLPDIYVASYNRYGVVMPDAWDRASNGTPNLLFINQGGGRFVEKGRELGAADTRWSYAASFADFDGDGDQDLFVANDFGEKGLFLNQDGRFQDVAGERGVLDPGNGMGVALGDYDNDGLLDLHFANMSSTAGNRILQRLFPKSNGASGGVLKKLAAGNSLYRNQGDGTFRDTTSEVGGFPAGWAWGGGFLDFDNDGFEDLYTSNGFISGKSMKDT